MSWINNNNFYLLSHELKKVNPLACFVLNSNMLLVFFYQARFLSDVQLNFEENLYLHYNADSLYIN